MIMPESYVLAMDGDWFERHRHNPDSSKLIVPLVRQLVAELKPRVRYRITAETRPVQAAPWASEHVIYMKV